MSGPQEREPLRGARDRAGQPAPLRGLIVRVSLAVARPIWGHTPLVPSGLTRVAGTAGRVPSR